MKGPTLACSSRLASTVTGKSVVEECSWPHSIGQATKRDGCWDVTPDLEIILTPSWDRGASDMTAWGIHASVAHHKVETTQVRRSGVCLCRERPGSATLYRGKSVVSVRIAGLTKIYDCCYHQTP